MPSWPRYELDLELKTDRFDDLSDYARVFGEGCLQSRPFLNLGAGGWKHPAWKTLDFVQPPYDKFEPPDLNVDLGKLQPLPIADESLYIVFTSHALEHLTTEQNEFWLREIWRVLKPGGHLRVVVPDMETAYWAYALGDMRYFDQRYNIKTKDDKTIVKWSDGFGRKFGSLERAFFARFASCFGNPSKLPGKDGRPRDSDEVIRELFNTSSAREAFASTLAKADYAKKRPQQHINWFTFPRMRDLMLAAGFDHVVRTSYGQSVCPLLRNKRYFDLTRPNESLYVDGIKAHPDLRISF